ncbi:MAG: hypothetical protein RXN81_05465 [Caldisphaera sp.]
MDMGFKYLVLSRILRSIGIIFVTLSSSLYLALIGVHLVIIGVIFAGVIGFSSMLSLILGMFGDRKGYKNAIIIGDSFAIIGVLILSLSKNVLLIAIALIIAGIGGTAGGMRGVYSPGLTALVMSNWEYEKERVNKIGILTSVASVSAIGGSLMLSIHSYLPFGAVGNYKFLFFVSFLMLLASLVSVFMVKEKPRPKKTTKIMKNSSLKYISKVILANSLAGFGIGMAIPLLPLWFSLYYHASSTMIGIVFTISYITTSLGSFMATRLSFESLRVGSITRILNGLFLVLMALSSFFFLAALFYIIRGFNAGFGAPNRTAVNIRGVSSEDYGTASSLQSIATRASQMSSGLSGYLMEIDLPIPLFIGGIFQAMSGILYMKLLKREN